MAKAAKAAKVATAAKAAKPVAAKPIRPFITVREGVVGAWKLPVAAPPHYTADASALDLWEPQVRHRILQAELLSGISYEGGQTVFRYSIADTAGRR